MCLFYRHIAQGEKWAVRATTDHSMRDNTDVGVQRGRGHTSRWRLVSFGGNVGQYAEVLKGVLDRCLGAGPVSDKRRAQQWHCYRQAIDGSVRQARANTERVAMGNDFKW
jgi:hypothetical protein